MTLVDLAIISFVLASIVHGLWLGAAVQVLSYGGFVGGLLLGSAIAPAIVDRADDPLTVRLLTIVVVFGTAVVVGANGRSVGLRVWRGLRKLRLSAIDAVLGAAVAGASALVLSWLVGNMLATVPRPELAAQIQRSVVLQELDAALPPAPFVVARVQGLLEDRGVPPVFAGLPPAPADRLPAPADPSVRQAFERAAGSVAQITGLGCVGVQQGSGFVAGDGLVVTNAHVVAGVDLIQVGIDGQTFTAVPVVFDPGLDVAVLRVDGLDAPPLPFATEEADRGLQGAALGYPLGGPLTAEPAVVLRRLDASGRDIYHEELVQRPVYEVQARIQPGNSGGPLVDAEGRVIGLVFSRSAAAADVGYAVTAEPVAAHVETARTRTDAVDIGPCRQP